jgi:hypothetical protein
MGRGPRLIVALVLALSAGALLANAVRANDNAQNTIAGSGSLWVAGSLLEQSGENCSTLGAPISETMVSATAAYGGFPSNSLPHVGARYYASVLVSIPGNPCGPGSSVVATDLVLPRGTAVDTTAPVRCFAIPRGDSQFGEVTNGQWNFNGFSGQYCSTSVGSSLTGTSGAVGVGFRPLATGTLFELFVPIVSSVPLNGLGSNPIDQATWVLETTGTYNTTGTSSVPVNVAPASGDSPHFFGTHDPAAVPYWVQNPADGFPSSRVEFLEGFDSAGRTGTVCYGLYQPDPAHDSSPATCAGVTGFPLPITNAATLWRFFGTGGALGPLGGYAVAFGAATPANQPWTMRWTFTPNDGGAAVAPMDIPFHTALGPDSDGDGVPDAIDQCNGIKGSLPNGCQPPVQTDPDGDGVFGANDKCPTQNGAGSLDGCPAPTPTTTTTTTTVPNPPPPPPPAAPTVKYGRASATRSGSASITIKTGVSVSCPAGGPACSIKLSATVPASAVKTSHHKSKSKKTPPPVSAGSARTSLAAGQTLSITFKLSSTVKSALTRKHRLTISLSGAAVAGPGGPQAAIKKSIAVSNPPQPKRHSRH